MNKESIPDEGIQVADLLGEKVTSGDLVTVVHLLSLAYGKNYADEINERVQLLFSMILSDNWTGERFMQTAKWIVKNRPYRDWTISDWYNAPLAKLFPYSKYISELYEKGKTINSEIQWYSVNGLNLFAYKKDGDLPFDKISTGYSHGGFTKSSSEEPPKVSVPMPEGLNKMFGVNKSSEDHRVRTNGAKPLTELLPIEGE